MTTRPIRKIVVHCSATKDGTPIRAADIDGWHRKKGWDGIGYHYVIGIDGRREHGRPEYKAGAHVRGHNADSIGICLIGGLDANGKAKRTYNMMQDNELARLLRELRMRYPDARICGHRDLSPDKNRDGRITPNEWLKDCPCFDTASWARTVGIDPKEPGTARAANAVKNNKPAVAVGTASGTAVAAYAAHELADDVPAAPPADVPLELPPASVDPQDVTVGDLELDPAATLAPVGPTTADTAIEVADAVHGGMAPLAMYGMGLAITIMVIGVLIVLVKALRK